MWFLRRTKRKMARNSAEMLQAGTGSRSGDDHQAAHEAIDRAAGLFLFDSVSDALRAEAVLKAAGYCVELVAPPQHLRAGCDLALALSAIERPGAQRVLVESKAEPRGWVDTFEGSLALASIVTHEDFGRWLMVRVGNMKITVEKATGRIVNTSGGGCPDIPYLNLRLVGASIKDVQRPKDLGYTLCGLMLDRAYIEAADMLAHSVEESA